MDFFVQYPAAFVVLITVLGLIIGSFLNVVIYRLPIMLHNEWRQECRAFLEIKTPQEEKKTTRFNLAIPRSQCPHCHKLVYAWDNLPLLSYIFLRGRCRHCRHPIAWRYPLVELLSGLLALAIALKFGIGWQNVICSLFSLVIVSIIFY